MLSFFPRVVLVEILNLIESVSEGFPSYSWDLDLFSASFPIWGFNCVFLIGGLLDEADSFFPIGFLVCIRLLLLTAGMINTFWPDSN